MATETGDSGSAKAASETTEGVLKVAQQCLPEKLLKQRLNADNGNDSGTDSEAFTENDVNSSAEWTHKAIKAKNRLIVPGRKRDLLNLQSALSPKYIGYANANSPTTISDSDDIIRATRRRGPALTLNSSCEMQANVNDAAAAVIKAPTSAPLLANSNNYMSPIDKLLLKNGASSPNTTGFEADAEDAATTQPQRKQRKRKQKRGPKSKVAQGQKKTIIRATQKDAECCQVKENGNAELAKLTPNVDADDGVIPTQTTDENEAALSDCVAVLEELQQEFAAQANIMQDEQEKTTETVEIETKITKPDQPENMITAEEPMAFHNDVEFTQPTSSEANVSEKSPVDSLESPTNLQTEVDGSSTISPSSVSIDSAKGSSIVTDSGWPSYQVGDLYWGRLLSFCYWPCMVCPDPAGEIVGNLQTHPLRKSNDGATVQIQVHVRFFADKCNRNWIKQENLLPYSDLDAFEALREEVRLTLGPKSGKYRQMVPSKAKVNTWHKAIEEAQIVAQLPYAERLEKLYEIYESSLLLQNKYKRKRTSSILQDTACSTSDVGSSLYDSTDNLTYSKLTSHQEAIARERSGSPFSPAFSPVKNNYRAKRRKLNNNAAEGNSSISVTPPETEAHQDMNRSAITSSDAVMYQNAEFGQLFDAVKGYVMVHRQDAKVEKCVLAVVRNIWSLKQLQLRELERELNNNEAQEALGSSSLKGFQGAGIKRLSNRLKTLMVRRSLTPVVTPTNTPTLTERRLSEQPKAKKVVNRPIEEVVEDTLQLDRKYLFKGISREPVCKYCYEPGGDLRRCGSNCNKWLHAACLERHKTGPIAKGGKKSKALLPKEEAQLVSAAPSELTDSSPTFDAEPATTATDQVSGEAESALHCHECATNAPETCCICQQLLAASNTPPSSPVKPTGEQQPSTSAAAEPHKLVACTQPLCARKFHPGCCKYWPQAKISKSSARCPMHVCHTCVSDDPHGKFQQLANTKLTKCVKCPATYHIDSYCIPAGSRILTTTHIICPRHNVSKGDAHVNVLWCYICVQGGELVCCETCPIAVHAHCRNIPIKPHESYICEECESGRLPLYGEIVWAKFNSFRWWPAIILPPTEIPNNILKKSHGPNEFVVRFFGTHDHGWISRRRVYLYIEGDAGDSLRHKSQLEKNYAAGVEEASRFLKIIKERRREQAIVRTTAGSRLQPPPYVKIKANKPVAPVRFVYNQEDVSVCECKPDQENPCGPESGCLNRMLYHECNPQYCPAGSRCNNQMFEMRKSPRFDVIYMSKRGFGLVSREPIAEGSFVVEYVGEVINHAEFQQRMQQKTRDRDENYYFLGVEKDFIIDAGPKGNLARFMNHSCEPNCETQKWSVNSIHRVGLFAIKDIPPDTELTFNYLWDDLMNNSKKACFCGAQRCSGEIGGKLKDDAAKETTAQPLKAKSKLKSLKRLQKRQKTKGLRIHISATKKGGAGKKVKVKPVKHQNADNDLSTAK